MDEATILFYTSLLGGGGLLGMLLRRTFSDRDTHAAGFQAGREDAERRYRAAFKVMIEANADLVAMAAPDRAVEAAMRANEALAALHTLPTPAVADDD